MLCNQNTCFLWTFSIVCRVFARSLRYWFASIVGSRKETRWHFTHIKKLITIEGMETGNRCHWQKKPFECSPNPYNQVTHAKLQAFKRAEFGASHFYALKKKFLQVWPLNFKDTSNPWRGFNHLDLAVDFTVKTQLKTCYNTETLAKSRYL